MTKQKKQERESFELTDEDWETLAGAAKAARACAAPLARGFLTAAIFCFKQSINLIDARAAANGIVESVGADIDHAMDQLEEDSESN